MLSRSRERKLVWVGIENLISSQAGCRRDRRRHPQPIPREITMPRKSRKLGRAHRRRADPFIRTFCIALFAGWENRYDRPPVMESYIRG